MTTSGRRDCFERTLQTFMQRVRPRPTAVYIYDDGFRTKARRYVADGFLDDLGATTIEVDGKRRRVGFCEATAACWKAAASEVSIGWFFHLEDDFEILRSVDLTDLAHVLSLERQVAQMALMRDAVNDVEKAAGGLYESRRDEYERRGTGSPNAWLEHRSYFTTNPALMRTSLARSFEWPTEKHCEGVYDHGLRRSLPDLTYGAWGVGTPWVRHIGEREGFGY